MKLWQRVSAISILILFLVVTSLSAVLLINAKDTILKMTVENTKTEQQNLISSFSGMANYYLKVETKSIVQRSGIQYCFSRFASETSVLVQAGEILYSNLSINPEKLLPIEDNYQEQVYQATIEDTEILIVGSNIPLFKDIYSVYVVKDITRVYQDIDRMILRFILISGSAILVGISLMVYSVRRSTNPLISLKDMAQLISQGQYNERINIHSKDEVGELAIAFNTMIGAVQSHIKNLEDILHRQNLFISGLTHEFKTPMTSMLLHTDTLLSTKLDEEKTLESLSHVYDQCRWLESLTQKLLKIIVLEEKIIVKAVSIKELFLDIYNSSLITLSDRNTPLKMEWNIDSLDLDYDLMKSLLINLVDNGSKASKKGQSIILRAYNNIIEVEDRGIGIPKEEIERITDPFYMVDPSRSKLKGGSGLGLTLVKKIADLHGINLIIESQLGLGTTFRLIFPK
ncbi:MAG TPA: HAMP domain-containing sensor histidine kinase [Clostridia bacterium]|nr:HAMP domain-containing sensor histidine kinase [Clostridia bacterium]